MATRRPGHDRIRPQRPHHEEGGFFSAEDADSPDDDGNGVEGLFSTWTPDEVRAAFAKAQPDIVDHDAGVLGHHRRRELRHDAGPRASPTGSTIATTSSADEITYARMRLAEARAERPRPGLDDKVILEWNALFLSALSQAGASSTTSRGSTPR